MVKIKVSVSLDSEFIAELDKIIEEYNLASRSVFIQKWCRTGLKELKKQLGIVKSEIAPEVGRRQG